MECGWCLDGICYRVIAGEMLRGPSQHVIDSRSMCVRSVHTCTHPHTQPHPPHPTHTHTRTHMHIYTLLQDSLHEHQIDDQMLFQDML